MKARAREVTILVRVGMEDVKNHGGVTELPPKVLLPPLWEELKRFLLSWEIKSPGKKRRKWREISREIDRRK